MRAFFVYFQLTCYIVVYIDLFVQQIKYAVQVH